MKNISISNFTKMKFSIQILWFSMNKVYFHGIL